MDSPASTSPPPPIYLFGPFALDPNTRTLKQDGRVVPLTAKAFDVLGVLVEGRGRVVSKEEVTRRVWPDTTVHDHNLTQQVSVLRRALGERPDQHCYIVTIPGMGYQFVAPVTVVEDHVTEESGAPVTSLAAPPVTEEAREPEVMAPPPSPLPIRSTRRAALAWATAVAATLIVSATLWSQRGAAQAPPEVVLRQFTYEAGFTREPAWAPDGQQLAFVSNRAGSADIWVQGLGESMPRRLTSAPSHESEPNWSPDGKRLAYRSERAGGGIFTASADGGNERQLTTFGHFPRWSRDGLRILFSNVKPRRGSNRFYIVDSNGGEPVRVLEEATKAFWAIFPVEAAWGPGGQVSLLGRSTGGEVMFTSGAIDGSGDRAWTITPQVAQRLKDTGLVPGRFTWDASGRYIYFEGTSEGVKNLWRVAADPASRMWTDGPQRLTIGAGEDAELALAPDGDRLAFATRTQRAQLWSFSFDPARGMLTDEGQPVGEWAVEGRNVYPSPDGRNIAYVAIRGGQFELRVKTFSGGPDRVLAAGQGLANAEPRWSPDGAYLVYRRREARDDGQWMASVAVVDVKTAEERLLTEQGQLEMNPWGWSRDGQTVLGACRNDSKKPYEVCTLPVAGAPNAEDQVRVLASDPNQSLFGQRFSPDERWISFIGFSRVEPLWSTVYIAPAQGGARIRMTSGMSTDEAPQWAPDGKALYFVSNRDGTLNVWGQRIDPASGVPAGEAFRVTAFNDQARRILTTPLEPPMVMDDRHLYLPVAETSSEIWVLDGLSPKE